MRGHFFWHSWRKKLTGFPPCQRGGAKSGCKRHTSTAVDGAICGFQSANQIPNVPASKRAPCGCTKMRAAPKRSAFINSAAQPLPVKKGTCSIRGCGRHFFSRCTHGFDQHQKFAACDKRRFARFQKVTALRTVRMHARSKGRRSSSR
jgi:hypothetical protein